MRPSSRLFLDPIEVYKNKHAKHNARVLISRVSTEADSAPELSQHPTADGTRPAGACAAAGGKEPSDWEVVAGVAESHPRLLVWLAEGRVTWYWNLFGTMIALLRLVPGLSWLVWHFLFEPVASNAPWRPELYEVILQEKRHQRNCELRSAKAPVTLTITDTPGLSAVTDGTTLGHSVAYGEIRDRINKMSSGCIGVSGLRGSGKSTVIRDFCGERYGTPVWDDDPPSVVLPGLRLMVQAPLLYDAREFLVHMYTCLCKAVLADASLNVTSFRRHAFFALLAPRSIRPAVLLRALGTVGLLIVAAGLAYRAVTGGWPLSSSPVRMWEVIGSVVAAVVALVVISWRTRQALLEMRQITTLATDAQDRLDRLHFQRTDTTGYAGTVGGGAGSSLNISSTHALTEQMVTLPELVDDYRDFAERVVAALQAAHLEKKPASENAGDVRLVIGIDQLDQIEDSQAAGAFLNELSSVFGTPHCVYLIAVSPGTLATVDQRIVPLKTSSGGIFDEMVWVEPLNLHQAGDLLDRRVIGLPATFIALCYVLSGGLPRDLFRIARAIFTAHGDNTKKPVTLSEATRYVIGDEIRVLKRRAVAHAAAQDVPVSPGLLKKLMDRDWPMSPASDSAGNPPAPLSLKTVLDEFSQMWAETARERNASPGQADDHLGADLCDNFLAGLYFLLTIYQLFTAGSDLLTGLGICEPGPNTCTDEDHLVLHGLADARVALSQNPYLATAFLRDATQALPERAGQPDLIAGIDPHFLGFTTHGATGFKRFIRTPGTTRATEKPASARRIKGNEDLLC
jgi:hypothetical protein